MRTLAQCDVGADEDHVAAPALHHPRKHRGGQPVRTDEVDLDLRLERIGIDLVEAAEEGVAGPGHEHLDVAELISGTAYERRHRVGIGDVQWQGDRLATIGANLGGDLLALVHPAGPEGDGEAASREFGGGGGADARRGAGDQCGPSGGVWVESGHQRLVTVTGSSAKPRTLLECTRTAPDSTTS